MEKTIKVLLFLGAFIPFVASANEGFKITGQSGLMYFVSIEAQHKDNEDIYRHAVGKACAGKSICQVHFWIGSAPSKLPFTDAQVNSKVANWQLNLNTGLRRWLVNCKTSTLFSNDRSCM